MNAQVALITGCSSGLGFALAKKLVTAGYAVHAGMRAVGQADALRAACNYAPSLLVSHLDLADRTSINETVRRVLTHSGRIDIVINNAATALLGPPDSASPEEAEYLFKVNVLSLIDLVQQVLPQMRKQQSGHILTVGSISSIESSAYLGVYAATKFAQEALMLSWATVLHKWNIRCTMVEPGAMNTALPHTIRAGSYYAQHEEDPYFAFNANALHFLRTVLQQGKDPDEVADLILGILHASQPKFRYPTCTFSKGLLERHLQDPSGDAWVEEHRAFAEQFYRKL
jgi:NAD(P)-dependent dehydrogenase (short-subunit alcohol dehydrogenase family)